MSTTVIEVGVDIPNASVMVIESAERFGLAQLHQLRGRVGRGAEQSYCILMTGNKLSSESKKRMDAMVATTDGFKIAELDLKMRGYGDMMGLRQSGMSGLKLADLTRDVEVLERARRAAQDLLFSDPELSLPQNDAGAGLVELYKLNIWFCYGRRIEAVPLRRSAHRLNICKDAKTPVTSPAL